MKKKLTLFLPSFAHRLLPSFSHLLLPSFASVFFQSPELELKPIDSIHVSVFLRIFLTCLFLFTCLQTRRELIKKERKRELIKEKRKTNKTFEKLVWKANKQFLFFNQASIWIGCNFFFIFSFSLSLSASGRKGKRKRERKKRERGRYKEKEKKEERERE